MTDSACLSSRPSCRCHAARSAKPCSGSWSGLAASASTAGDTTDLVALLRASIADHTEAIRAGDEQAIIAADQAFHQALLEASGNPHLERALVRPATTSMLC